MSVVSSTGKTLMKKELVAPRNQNENNSIVSEYSDWKTQQTVGNHIARERRLVGQVDDMIAQQSTHPRGFP
jgi:hypothetical protein